MDACQGDSGGPAGVLENGRVTQASVFQRDYRVTAHSSGWHCESWERLRGPAVPRTLHKGFLTVDLVEEDNFWTHCMEQQLPKNIKASSKQTKSL